MTDLKTNNHLKRLDRNRGKIFSKTGGWIAGQGIYTHGYSMLDDLIGKKSYFQIMILNATGKLVERRLADWVEAVYGCSSWPDPRIWCNQVGALSGCSRTTVVAATAMGLLASDSRVYGMRTLVEGIEFIQLALKKYNEGISVQSIVEASPRTSKGQPKMMGYIRPLARGDERIETMERVSRDLGFTKGAHLKLACKINDYSRGNYNEGMNLNGYISAFLSDLNFSPVEAYQIFAAGTMSGITACYLEQLHKSPDEFLPLQCDDVDYVGPEARQVHSEFRS